MPYLLLTLSAFAAGAVLGVFVWHLAARLHAADAATRLERRERRARRGTSSLGAGSVGSPLRDRMEPIPEWLQYSFVPDRSPLYTPEQVAAAKRALRPGFGIVIRVRP